MDTTNETAMAIQPSITWRIKQKLFPQHGWEWSEKRGKFMEERGNKGTHVEVFTYFDWRDRLRVLLTGSINVRVTIACENDPGRTQSIAQVTVLPDKRSMAG